MMMTRDEILAVYHRGPDAVVSVVEKLLGAIGTLEQQVNTQRQQIASLTARVKELEDQISKNSRNSSKPPASDGLAKKPKSRRHKSGNPAGGQPGHPGTTLCLSDTPDEVVLHTPPTCSCCGHALDGVAPSGSERRQVHDLPPLRLQVTEHRTLCKVCPLCQSVNRACFPEFVSQPVQYGPGVRALCVYLQHYQLLPFARTGGLLRAHQTIKSHPLGRMV